MIVSLAQNISIAIPFLFVLAATAHGAPTPAASVESSPLPPESALSAFQLEPGLRVELVAAEPTVIDPVAMAFDERGRLFVAENRGYPTGPPAGDAPAGVIALLEDRDGDGHYETRHDYATHLTFPNGVLPWKDGVIVTCAPDVLHLRDTNGDGHADVRQVLLTGFATNASTQLRVSHPTLGPDGWIYLTCGLSGGTVTSPLHPERPPFEVRGDVRFHPSTLQVEAADGRGQFGQTFNDAGHRFVCHNRVHIQHVVLSSRHLERNPHLAFSSVMQDCPDLEPNPFLRGGGGAARIYPISDNLTTADSHAGTFSAACGLLIHRGSALPDDCLGNAFVCDPTGNLIHRDRLLPHGATFAAQRVHEQIEFCASTDNWFRPVFLAHGPDGALYVCDMYRKTIEHPDYLPEEVRKRTDFDSGSAFGRIYRIIADSAPPRSEAPVLPDFNEGSLPGLVALLKNENGWVRDTAFRLLVERSDSAAIPALRKLLSDDAPPPAAVAALRLLDHFDGIESPLLEQALQHEAPMVRETAVTLVESRIATQPGLIEGLLALADDPDARVRFQTALALGESRDSRSLTALAMIADRHGRDRWTRAAVLSSVAGRERMLLSRLLETSPSVGTMEPGALLFDLGRIIGASCQPEEFTNLVTQLVQEVQSQQPAVRIGLVSGALNGLRPSLKTNDRDSVLGLFGGTEQRLETSPPASTRALLNEAVSLARNPSTPLESRLHAIPLLALLEAGQSVGLLTGLIDHREPASVQATAIETLGGIDSELVTRELLEPDRWRSLTPAARERALAELTSRRHHVTRLLEGIAEGRPATHFLNAAQRQRLLNHPEPEIRARARQLLDAPAPADRMAALEDSKAALRLNPHPENGRAVFLRACASCHRLDREGTAFGPDLFDVRNQSKESLLLHLVVPEHEIAPGYAGYTVETTDGRTLSGIIVAETATGITLRQPLGVEETLLRERIARIDADELSLMPQELEKSMTLQELADLLAWLKGEN